MRIDVHNNYYAEPYIGALVASGRPEVARATMPNDIDDRIAKMDAAGTDVTVFSAIGLGTDVADRDGARHSVQVINDLYVDLRAQYDGRLTGFASVSLNHPDLAVEEAARALDELGLPGVALPCITGGKAIDHPDYTSFWEYLGSREGRPVVYVHPCGVDSKGHPGFGEWGMNMLFGSPVQVAAAPLRLALSGITTRHPKVQFIFALCAGVLPYLWPRYERNLRKGLEMNKTDPGPGMFSWLREVDIDEDDPMTLFKTNFWFDTSVQDIPAALRLSKETFGIDHVMLGSDETHASLAESVENIENSPDLTAEEKHRILDVAAQELLQLPAPAVPATGARR